MLAQIILIGLGAALLLGGCATSTWNKQGATPEEMRLDASQCDFEARSAASSYRQSGVYRGGIDPFLMNGGSDAIRMIRESNYLSLCMRAKGYDEVPLHRK
jgi:hypothetical protein